MAVAPRLFLFTAIAAAPALLITGCGEDATGARTTIAEVQSTSYVVQPPITTTTTTTLPSDVPEGVIDPNEQTYTVQSGDSVYGIARKFGLEPTVLANYNSWPEGINHPVFVGDIVKVPPQSQVPSSDPVDDSADEPSDTEPDDTEESAPAEGVACEHTVVAGDNPTRLSEQYEVTLDELAAANAGNPAYQHFQLGSQIHIPLNGSC
jgi:LysM repeat protein